MTNHQAAQLVAQALSEGHTLTVPCPNGDTLTVGRSGRNNTWFEALRWGRSRWALPCGKHVAEDPQAFSLAHVVVEHTGRGAAAKAARTKLEGV